MSVATMTPAELRVAARARLAPQDHVDRHWSVVAPMLRRVDAERLYEEFARPAGEEPYTSTQQWAEDELGLDSYDLVRLLHLAEMMSAAPQVTAEQWRRVSKSKAREVKRVVDLGGSPTHWVSRAAAAANTGVLRAEIARHLDPEGTPPEVYVTKRIRMPVGSLTMFEAALELALDEAVGQPGQDRERIYDPDVAFRCLDVITREFVLSVERRRTSGVEDSEIPDGLHAAVLQAAEDADGDD